MLAIVAAATLVGCNLWKSPASPPSIENSTAPVAQAPDISRNPQLLYTLTGSGARSLAISSDGKILVSADDEKVKIWNLGTSKLTNTLSGRAPVAIGANGQTLVSGGDEGTVKITNLGNGNLKSTLNVGYDVGVEIGADGLTVATGSYDNPKDPIKIWDVTTGNVQRTLSEGGNPLAISPDGQTLVSVSSDKTLKVWNLATGAVVSTFSSKASEILSATISADGQTLALGTYGDGMIELWDLPTGKLQRSFSGGILSLAISPDGETLASGGDRFVELWNLPTGQKLATLEHTSQVASLTFSPDGQILAAGTGRVLDVLKGEKTIKVWRVMSNP